MRQVPDFYAAFQAQTGHGRGKSLTTLESPSGDLYYGLLLLTVTRETVKHLLALVNFVKFIVTQ